VVRSHYRPPGDINYNNKLAPQAIKPASGPLLWGSIGEAVRCPSTGLKCRILGSRGAPGPGLGPTFARRDTTTVFRPLKNFAGPRTQDFKSASQGDKGEYSVALKAGPKLDSLHGGGGAHKSAETSHIMRVVRLMDEPNWQSRVSPIEEIFFAPSPSAKTLRPDERQPSRSCAPNPSG